MELADSCHQRLRPSRPSPAAGRSSSHPDQAGRVRSGDGTRTICELHALRLKAWNLSSSCRFERPGGEAINDSILIESTFEAVLAACLGTSSTASAGEPSGTFNRVSCSVVRFYVAKYSAAAAEQWARSNGATDAE